MLVPLFFTSAIIILGAFLFAAVERLEPNPRIAIILKCAILATGGAVIAEHLLLVAYNVPHSRREDC